MKNIKTHFFIICLYALVMSVFISCTPIKKLRFVADEPSSGTVKNDYYNNRTEKTIQPYDYLYIKIFSLDEKTNAIFNETSYNMDSELLSYSVDGGGNISLPFIGFIQVKDLNISQAREKVEKSLANYLNNISVIVRFVSNKVTVLGEVTQPGQHSFYDEKVSIFQAIGFAGGASQFGNLSNVTLVREKDNVIKYFTLDLTKKNIASSEFYYLLPNDILIINPIKAKYRELKDYGINLTATVLTAISSLFGIILISRSL